jgi:hypothetical protein
LTLTRAVRTSHVASPNRTGSAVPDRSIGAFEGDRTSVQLDVDLGLSKTLDRAALRVGREKLDANELNFDPLAEALRVEPPEGRSEEDPADKAPHDGRRPAQGY